MLAITRWRKGRTERTQSKRLELKHRLQYEDFLDHITVLNKGPIFICLIIMEVDCLILPALFTILVEYVGSCHDDSSKDCDFRAIAEVSRHYISQSSV